MALKETIQEFKEFAIKGNVVDMAVGVIIGGAFGKIVTSFVNDLIMPIIGKRQAAQISASFICLWTAIIMPPLQMRRRQPQPSHTAPFLHRCLIF